MLTVKPHTLNRPLCELRQLRENPELIAKLGAEEMRKLALFAICNEENERPHRNPPNKYMDVEQQTPAPR